MSRRPRAKARTPAARLLAPVRRMWARAALPLSPLRELGWRRSLLALALLACGLWTAWMVVSLHLARHFSRVAPVTSLKWRADYAPALDAVASQSLRNGDIDAARDAALKALRAEPMDRGALAVLAEVEEKSENEARASAILEEAGRRSLRDPAVQAKLIVKALEQGDAAGAMLRVDALLRARTVLDKQLYDLVANLVAQPAYRSDVMARLALMPPWRGRVIDILASSDNDDLTAAVLDDLRATGGPPTFQENRLYLSQLLRVGKYAEARAAWQALPGNNEIPSTDGNQLINPGFERTPDGMPFDWSVAGTAKVEMQIVPRPDQPGTNAMRITFIGGRVDFTNLRQNLALAPGSYRLSGSVKAEGLQNERGLLWTVTCRGTGKVLVRTAPIRGTLPWTPFEASFTVPEEKCTSQLLILMLASRLALDQEISGVLWLDDMSIMRTDEAAPG